ncbi:MAG TPA: homoserine O-acetyltransferase [Symbiobacteriaceae bacterium]|nr:homoserine O-acetyltransferase [Symbiobacteriaceae bacterium]
MAAAELPVHLSRRQYAVVATAANPLPLDCGRALSEVTLCYETFGTLSERADNAVLICHALTGDSHVAGKYDPADRKPGWWDQAVGPGKAIDTDRYFVICTNVLGGCQGSTGPASINPETRRPYGLDFPLVTARDMVRAQARLLDLLGIGKLHAVIGGSLGAMQTLQWAVTYPDRVRGIVPIGGAGRFHPQGIALNEVQRQAIMSDPGFLGGQYYGTPGPAKGLATARMLGMITYRSDESMWQQFGRQVRGGKAELPAVPDIGGITYEVESYLRYQGDALVRRFDANSYLYLTRAMDLQDIGRGYESYEAAHGAIGAKVLSIGIRSDLLFPTYLQRETTDLVRAAGGAADYLEMDSPWGHDAFLVDFHLIAQPVRSFLSSF